MAYLRIRIALRLVKSFPILTVLKVHLQGRQADCPPHPGKAAKAQGR